VGHFCSPGSEHRSRDPLNPDPIPIRIHSTDKNITPKRARTQGVTMLSTYTYYMRYLFQKELNTLGVSLPDGGQQGRDTVLVHQVQLSALIQEKNPLIYTVLYVTYLPMNCNKSRSLFPVNLVTTGVPIRSASLFLIYAIFIPCRKTKQSSYLLTFKEPRNESLPPAYVASRPIRQTGLSYRTAKLGIDS
jgi:hypothetical protein